MAPPPRFAAKQRKDSEVFDAFLWRAPASANMMIGNLAGWPTHSVFAVAGTRRWNFERDRPLRVRKWSIAHRLCGISPIQVITWKRRGRIFLDYLGDQGRAPREIDAPYTAKKGRRKTARFSTKHGEKTRPGSLRKSWKKVDRDGLGDPMVGDDSRKNVGIWQLENVPSRSSSGTSDPHIPNRRPRRPWELEPLGIALMDRHCEDSRFGDRNTVAGTATTSSPSGSRTHRRRRGFLCHGWTAIRRRPTYFRHRHQHRPAHLGRAQRTKREGRPGAARAASIFGFVSRLIAWFVGDHDHQRSAPSTFSALWATRHS